MIDPIMITINDPTDFLIDEPIHTQTSSRKINTSMFPTIQPSLDPSQIPSPEPSFEIIHIPGLLQGLFPSDVQPDLPIQSNYLAPSKET